MTTSTQAASTHSLRRLPAFHRWVSVIALIATALALMTLSPLIGELTGLLTRTQSTINAPAPFDPFLARIIHGVQAATILCFVLIHRKWLEQVKSQLTDAVPIAKTTLEQFSAGWVRMWYCWVALYVWFCFTAPWSEAPRISAVSNILNAASGFNIWWCVLVLAMPSVNIDGDPHRDRDFRRAKWMMGICGFFCAFLGAADRLLGWSPIGVVVGLYNALALICLAGVLGSSYMRIRWRGLLLCLYLYSVVQLLYSFLPSFKMAIWFPLIFLSALALKIAVAYTGYDILRHGGLLRYLMAAQAGKLSTPWTSPVPATTSTLAWVDNEIMRLIALIDFRSRSFYAAVSVISLALASAALGPAHLLEAKTAVVTLGVFGGISSGLALLKEGFAIHHHTTVRICLVAAAFIMLIETGLVLQLGLRVAR